MAKYRFSAEADSDLEAITAYTAERYGLEQAERYAMNLLSSADLAATFPTMGRLYVAHKREFRRYSAGRHVLFYIEEPEGILIVRILHQAMDADRHLKK